MYVCQSVLGSACLYCKITCHDRVHRCPVLADTLEVHGRNSYDYKFYQSVSKDVPAPDPGAKPCTANHRSIISHGA